MSNFLACTNPDEAELNMRKTAVGINTYMKNMAQRLPYWRRTIRSHHLPQICNHGDGILTAIKMMEVILEKNSLSASYRAGISTRRSQNTAKDKKAARRIRMYRMLLSGEAALGKDGRILVRESKDRARHAGDGGGSGTGQMPGIR